MKTENLQAAQAKQGHAPASPLRAIARKLTIPAAVGFFIALTLGLTGACCLLGLLAAAAVALD